MASDMKMLTLVSADGYEFEVGVKLAMKSQLLFHMIEDGCADGSIPILNVTADILDMVLAYCQNHVKEEGASTSVASSSSARPPEVEMHFTDWEKKFFKVDLNTLCGLIMAANYLAIKRLLDQGCLCIANMMKGKSPAAIRKMFHIKNDFTKEEEEAYRKKYPWAFEGIPL